MNQSSQRISQQILQLEETKALEAELKDQLKEIHSQAEAQEADVIRAILDLEEETGTQNLRITVNGRNYSVGQKTYYRIPAAKRETAFPALRDLGLGDLITERVDDRTLTKALAAVAEEAGGELPAEYDVLDLESYDKPALYARKA